MSRNFETSYISSGCNKSPNAADWGRNNLICYGACNSIAIYDPKVETGRGKIIHTLYAHKGRVNSVRWLKTFTETVENQIISASADGTAIIWSWSDESNSWLPESTLTGHKNIVNVADGLVKMKPKKKYVRNETPLMTVTASVDSTVKVWSRQNDHGKIECIDTIDWGSGFCLDVRLAPLLDADLILLACAADDNKVHLFTETQASETETPENRFVKVHVLIGHDDWVRSLDFIYDMNNDLFLATASQDNYIRVHKFHHKPAQTTIMRPKRVNEIDLKEDLEPEEKLFKVWVNQTEHHYAVILETILAGHEGWVYGVSWHPPVYKTSEASQIVTEMSDSIREQKIKLLSTSMDKTMIIWSPDESGTWNEEARLGEVGGNTLGFYGGKFGYNGLAIMGHGYQGSFHMWKYNEENKNWEPCVVVGGHTGEVMDVAWDWDGNYILSSGSDQTTRLHAPWVRSDEDEVTWHEIARPQIHGYDMSSLAILGKYKYASGAEEKVIRAFSAPNNFVENFKRISGIGTDEKLEEDLPQGATVPALGLTNKPVFEQMKKEGYIVDDDYPDLYFSPIHLTKPPTEENLMQNTLWPEVQKLYGHGYEIYSLAARNDGVVLASSCKATSAEHASIILWNVKTWLQIQKLTSHQLTVTQLSFSPNGKYLLSVSRDRRWSLFEVKEDNKSYELLYATDSKGGFHTRIIWCCAWTYDSTTFATGSRDGKIGIWGNITRSESEPTKVDLLANLELPKESVTALAFSPVLIKNFHLLAIGLETGIIHLYRYFGAEIENLWVVFQGDLGHHLSVKRLAFRPKLGRSGVSKEKEDSNVIQLASCGSDHILKIFDVYLNLL